MLQETHEYVHKKIWIEIMWSNATNVIEYNFRSITEVNGRKEHIREKIL